MKIVSWCPFAESHIDRSLVDVENVTLVHVRSHAELEHHIASADALLIPGSGGIYDAQTAGILRSTASRLRWIQCLTAGHESFALHGVPAGVVLTSAGGSNAKGVAEHAMALLLSLVRCIPDMVEAQRNAVWASELSGAVGSLEGKRVAVIGAGQVGLAFARLAKAFDMHTVGVNRSVVESRYLDEYRSLRDLDAVLATCEMAVVSLALTPETVQIMGERQLTLLGPKGYLINVGRGGLVECNALHAVTQSGLLAGAGLDVTDPEPLPASHPLWRNSRILICPHLGGYGHSKSFERLGEVAKRNLVKFAGSTGLQNEIRLER